MTAAGLITVALLGAPAAPVGCSDVTVVVEPARQAAEVACVPARPGRSAAEVFEAAGHELERVQRFPGAVCRVDGAPEGLACVAMPPADAYWGFFHAGEGDWAYATVGVDAVEPAAGEAIAMAWQDTSTPVPPAVDPAAPADAEPAGGAAGPGDQAGPEPAEGSQDAGEDIEGGTLSPVLSAAVVAVAGVLLALVMWRRRR